MVACLKKKLATFSFHPALSRPDGIAMFMLAVPFQGLRELDKTILMVIPIYMYMYIGDKECTRTLYIGGSVAIERV